MSDLIDRDAVIREVGKYSNIGTLNEEERIALIMSIPTIDAVEVVRGEWVDMGDFEQCSACRGTRLKEFQSYYGKTTWIKTPYCPNCGAKMKGADDE